mmetsp:Transcript_94505/g.267480  ORF Transcript_94505/g.267480 Transcript_94505/m.267480 type:complete len:213 (+) Transcript_94505:563-1201(+)
MGTHSVTSSCWSSRSTKEEKKSSRLTFGGPMHSVSMSLPGCTTPSLYEPSVVTLAAERRASSSDAPAPMPMATIQSISMCSISLRTACRRAMPSGVSAGNSASRASRIRSLSARSASAGSWREIGSVMPYFTGGPALEVDDACGVGPGDADIAATVAPAAEVRRPLTCVGAGFALSAPGATGPAAGGDAGGCTAIAKLTVRPWGQRRSLAEA